MSKQNIMARDILQCPDCRESTQILIDYSQGVVLCRSCGLVLESSCIDDSQEWRSFSDSAGDAKSDRNRVGAISSDPFFDQASGTSIAAGGSRLSRTHFLAMGSEASETRNLAKAHSVLRELLRAFSFPDSIYGRCCEVLKFLDESDNLRNRTSHSWVLAILYLACRQARAGRTISELVKAHPTVKEAEVARNYWKLDKLLAGTKVRDSGQVGQGTSSDNFITRYCSRLGLPTVVSAAEHVASQASRYGLAGGRSPNVVATAAIYIVAHLLQVPNLPTMDEIAEIAQVRVSAVKQAYQAIRQPIDRLLPQDFQIDFSHSHMRYGKKLALMTENCAAKGIERPLISHRVLKEHLTTITRILKADSDTEAVPSLITAFQRTLRADLDTILSYVELEIPHLDISITRLERQGRELGFLGSTVLHEFLCSIESTLVSPCVDLQNCIGEHAKNMWLSLTIQVATYAERYSEAAVSLQSLLAYADINVAGFRKLIKQYAKQVPGAFRADVVSVYDYHRIVSALVPMAERMNSMRDQTERIMQKLSPGVHGIHPLRIGSETLIAISTCGDGPKICGSGASTAPASPTNQGLPDFAPLLHGTNVNIASLESKLLDL